MTIKKAEIIKCLFFASGFMTFIFFMASGPAESGLSVSGALLVANVTPGQHINHSINVSIDETDTPIDVRIEVDGFGQGLDGANNDLRAGLDKSPYSARPFIRVSPNSFRIKPGEIRKVQLEVNVPQDVGEGGRYALVNISSPPLEIGIVSLVIAVDVPILLAINETEKIKTGEISELIIDKPVSSNQQNISVILKNTGNYHYKAYAEAILIDKKGEILAHASTPLSLTSILPFTLRLFELSLVPNIPLDSGTYYINTTMKEANNMIIASRTVAFNVP